MQQLHFKYSLGYLGVVFEEIYNVLQNRHLTCVAFYGIVMIKFKSIKENKT